MLCCSRASRDRAKGEYPVAIPIVKQNHCICQEPARVRLVADLSAAAFKSKQTNELITWHRLRSLDIDGKGRMFESQAIEGLKQISGLSERHIFRRLAAGEGIFWHRYDVFDEDGQKRGSRIKIYGVKQVCEYYNTTLISGARWYDVPVDKFRGLRQARLRLWESLHKASDVNSNPISRATFQECTGVNDRQQRRYDRASEVKTRTCWRPAHKSQPRLPNKYNHRQKRGAIGQLRKVRQSLKLSFKTAEAMGNRCYFATIRQMLKTKNREQVSYTFTRRNKRRIKGRLEWEPVLSMQL